MDVLQSTAPEHAEALRSVHIDWAPLPGSFAEYNSTERRLTISTTVDWQDPVDLSATLFHESGHALRQPSPPDNPQDFMEEEVTAAIEEAEYWRDNFDDVHPVHDHVTESEHDKVMALADGTLADETFVTYFLGMLGLL